MKDDAKVSVDGTEYILKCMKTSLGARVLLQMGRLLLPSVKVFTIFDFKQKLLDLADVPFNLDDLAGLLGRVLREDEMMTLVETVLAPCHANDGTRVFQLTGADYEAHFSGRYETMFKVFGLALKQNYASFFLGLRGESLLGILKESLTKAKQAKSASQPPPSSTPTSGGSS